MLFGRLLLRHAYRAAWAYDFGDGPRHPTQLYESAFHLSAAFVLSCLERRVLFRGQLIKLYIIAYLCDRFATEFIRPEAKWAYGLTGYQWACLAFILTFVGLWMRSAMGSW